MMMVMILIVVNVDCC